MVQPPQATTSFEDSKVLRETSSESVGLRSKLDYNTRTWSTNNNNINGMNSQASSSSFREDSYTSKSGMKLGSSSRQTSTRSESKNSKNSKRMNSSRSCRSEMDLVSMGEQNRERLLDAFLPDIRRVHARMSYEHRVRPFNLNHEGLKNVQIRAKTAGEPRYLREHRDETLGRGRKAASNITPRPAWLVKDVPVNAVQDRLFPGEGPAMYAYVKRQQWDYIDRRTGMKRVLPKRTHTK